MSTSPPHIPLVDLVAQYQAIKPEMDAAISGVIGSGHFIGGEPIKDFAREFAAFTEVPFCVPCANGTDAIEIALNVLGIGPGDEVYLPSHSWPPWRPYAM